MLAEVGPSVVRLLDRPIVTMEHYEEADSVAHQDPSPDAPPPCGGETDPSREERSTFHNGRPQEFSQEEGMYTSSIPFPFLLLSLYSSLPFPFHPAMYTLPFLLCREVDPLNTTMGLGEPSGIWGRAPAATTI